MLHKEKKRPTSTRSNLVFQAEMIERNKRTPRQQDSQAQHAQQGIHSLRLLGEATTSFDLLRTLLHHTHSIYTTLPPLVLLQVLASGSHLQELEYHYGRYHRISANPQEQTAAQRFQQERSTWSLQQCKDHYNELYRSMLEQEESASTSRAVQKIKLKPGENRSNLAIQKVLKSNHEYRATLFNALILLKIIHERYCKQYALLPMMHRDKPRWHASISRSFATLCWWRTLISLQGENTRHSQYARTAFIQLGLKNPGIVLSPEQRDKLQAMLCCLSLQGCTTAHTSRSKQMSESNASLERTLMQLMARGNVHPKVLEALHEHSIQHNSMLQPTRPKHSLQAIQKNLHGSFCRILIKTNDAQAASASKLPLKPHDPLHFSDATHMTRDKANRALVHSTLLYHEKTLATFFSSQADGGQNNNPGNTRLKTLKDDHAFGGHNRPPSPAY
jgi:hypothetical protein